jgi:hypothetical protein
MISHGFNSPDALRTELTALNRQLDTVMLSFGDFEISLNAELKTAAAPEARAAIFARRAEYEDLLGIETLVERIDSVRERLRDVTQ